jgi:calcineurin-like phosphoesterase family protein
MNETIISNCNSIVGPEDTVWHLGDFAHIWKNDTSYIDILKRLNGEIYLILGNHDNRIDKSLFKAWYKETSIIHNVDGINRGWIKMTHKPTQVFDEFPIYLHGHTHRILPDTHNVYDVGIDNNDFKPISIEEIQEKLKGLQK